MNGNLLLLSSDSNKNMLYYLLFDAETLKLLTSGFGCLFRLCNPQFSVAIGWPEYFSRFMGVNTKIQLEIEHLVTFMSMKQNKSLSFPSTQIKALHRPFWLVRFHYDLKIKMILGYDTFLLNLREHRKF
jgi:hypothetical protein